MKKIILFGVALLFVILAEAQVISFNKAVSLTDKELTAKNISAIRLDSSRQNHPDSIINILSHEIDSVLTVYYQKRLTVLANSNMPDKKEVIAKINQQRDSIVAERRASIRQIKYWEKFDRFEEIHNHRPSNKYQWHNFFPAYYSSQAINFFESDTIHKKLFQNNLVNYNPKTQKMILYTEAVNDYVGPVRVGIGFQIESDSKIDSLSTVDSTIKEEKKTDLMAAIQNGGGDFSVNIKLPVIKSGNPDGLIQYKFNLYANSGFSLPVLNKASDDFIFNYDGGIEGAFYASGFNGRLTFYSQIKAAYYNGNKNYKKVIKDANKNDPTSFFMLQSSFGIDFLDGYRIRVDLYSGNSFIRKNFPATVTFVVRPGKDKK